MTNKNKHFLICLMVVLVSVIIQPVLVLGDSTNAQVVVPSEISFYEDKQSTGDASKTSSSAQKNSNNNQHLTSNTTEKKGILPQTGEIIKDYGYIGVILVLVVLLLFFLRKRRKDEDDEK